MERWIDARERLPARADADAWGCVIAWHVYNGTMVTGWHQVERNRYFTHWMPAPGPPPNIAEAKQRIEEKP